MLGVVRTPTLGLGREPPTVHEGPSCVDDRRDAKPSRRVVHLPGQRTKRLPQVRRGVHPVRLLGHGGDGLLPVALRCGGRSWQPRHSDRPPPGFPPTCWPDRPDSSCSLAPPAPRPGRDGACSMQPVRPRRDRFDEFRFIGTNRREGARRRKRLQRIAAAPIVPPGHTYRRRHGELAHAAARPAGR